MTIVRRRKVRRDEADSFGADTDRPSCRGMITDWRKNGGNRALAAIDGHGRLFVSGLSSRIELRRNSRTLDLQDRGRADCVAHGPLFVSADSLYENKGPNSHG